MKNRKITGTTLFLLGILVGVALTSLLLFCSTTYFKIGGASVFRSRYIPQLTATQTKTLFKTGLDVMSKKADADPLPW